MVQELQKFTLVTISPKLTDIMKMNIEAAHSAGINFIWIKHIQDSDFTYIGELQTLNMGKSKIYLIEFKTKLLEDFYNNAILYRSAKIFLNSEKIEWFFWIDSDELVSSQMVFNLKNIIKSLDKKYLYGVPRLWVKKFNDKWFSSGIARSDKSKFDLQYRIFNPDGVKPDYGVHKNFKSKGLKQLNYIGEIIHLIYEIENLEDRCVKISDYESVEEGSGLSKLRYYLPEIFSKSKVYWTEVTEEQNRLLNKVKIDYL